MWGGVDVGGERAATAVVWINDGLHVGAAVYHGNEGVIEAVDHVRELAATYNVRGVAYDPWRFGQAAQELEREGVMTVAVPQTGSVMVPASDRLYQAVVEKRLTLPDHDELPAAAIARHSRRGWRLDKTQRSDHIDGVIALAMALHLQGVEPEPVEVVEWL